MLIDVLGRVACNHLQRRRPAFHAFDSAISGEARRFGLGRAWVEETSKSETHSDRPVRVICHQHSAYTHRVDVWPVLFQGKSKEGIH